MAQTIWIQRLENAKKSEAEGMDFACVHLHQRMEQVGKLTKEKGWNLVPNATEKDGTAHKALCCDTCAKNYKDGSVRLAKEPVHA
jgi:predicted lipoprotein with Yx(FWY)xxD motif